MNLNLHLVTTLAVDNAPKAAGPGADQESTGQTSRPGGGTGDTGGGSGGGILGGGMLPLLLIMAVIFVFMIGGPRKEKKRREAMLSALKKGDRILTTGGIVGRVVELKDAIVTVESGNSRLDVSQAAVASVIDAKDESKEVKESK